MVQYIFRWVCFMTCLTSFCVMYYVYQLRSGDNRGDNAKPGNEEYEMKIPSKKIKGEEIKTPIIRNKTPKSYKSLNNQVANMVNKLQNRLDQERGNQLNKFNRCYKEVISQYFAVKSVNITKFTKFNKDEIQIEIKQHCLINVQLKQCPPPLLLGRLKVNQDGVSEDYIYKNELQFVRYGGWWAPSNCTSSVKQKIAIIIPFRNRHAHLPILLRHLHPILRRQQLHYRIFVIEQDDNDGFNKAKMLNIAFLEIQKLFPYTCFVFHDVDLLPEDDRIDYACKQSPLHLAAAVNKFHYKLFFDKQYGGVVMIAPKDFVKINGLSNGFWVWGGEDDILYERAVLHGLKPNRENMTIGRYTMLAHTDRERVRTNKEYKEMLRSVKLAMVYAKEDGLNSLTYKVTDIKIKQLYTLIKVNLLKAESKIFGFKSNQTKVGDHL